MTYFSACVALGKDAAGAGGSDETGPSAGPLLTTAENTGCDGLRRGAVPCPEFP